MILNCAKNRSPELQNGIEKIRDQHWSVKYGIREGLSEMIQGSVHRSFTMVKVQQKTDCFQCQHLSEKFSNCFLIRARELSIAAYYKLAIFQSEFSTQ